MLELKLPCMKEVAFEAVSFAVKGISCDRMSQTLKMDADLVGTPRVRHAGYERPAVTGGKEFVVGYCIPSRGGPTGRHLLPLNRVTAYRQIDGSLRVARPSPDDGKIGFLHLTVGERLGERRMDLIVLGYDNATAGLLVQAMDNTWTMLLGTRREGGSVIQEGVDESAIFMASTYMHDHAGRLIDHEEILILVQDFQGDILGSGSCWWLCRLLLDSKEIARLHLFIVFDRFSTQGNSSRFHKRLDLGTRKMR